MKKEMLSNRPLFFVAMTMLTASAMALSFAGCKTNLGLSPGVLDGSSSTSFNGITSVTLLSPNTAQASWNASSKYKSYKVFSAGASQPVATSLFSTAMITGLSPATSYTFSVGDSSSLYGLDTTVAVQTWPNFTGATSIAAPAPTTIQVGWTFPAAGPTYKVYVNQGSIPTDFSTPDLTTQALSGVLTTWGGSNAIQQSALYYVVVRASYLDGSSESNLNALSVTTPSAINPLPTLSSAPTILGTAPVIVVSGGLPGYKTTFSIPSGVLGTITGNGQYTVPTSKPLANGPNVITAVVSYQGNSVTLPPFTVVSRTLSSSTVDAPLMFGGKGKQFMGAVLTVGDFNCDGYDDIAVSAPLGTFYTDSNVGGAVQQGKSNGAVYVFYGGGPQGLILPGQVISGVTVPDPSQAPTGKNPLFIPFPNNIVVPMSTSWGGMVGSAGPYFGYSLAAGNINGDTQTIGPNTYACDDLVIGAPYVAIPGVGPTGATFIYYGSPFGVQLGTPLINSPACSGGVCAPQEIVPAVSASDANIPLFGPAAPLFGSALALGNFDSNVLGYHGLAISSPTYSGDTNGAQAVAGKVFIYKADSTGILTTGSVNTGYAATTFQAPASSYGLVPSLTPVAGSYGVALAAVDIDGDGYDDLFVGSPIDYETVDTVPSIQRGSVYYYHNTHVATAGFAINVSPNKQLQAGLNTASGYAPGTYQAWGGALAKAGDLNGDGIPDLIVGSSFGGMTGLLNAGATNTVFSAIYGSGAGPQGFGAPTFPTPSPAVAPILNAVACNSGCASGTYCTGCVVQHFTSAASGGWLNTTFGSTSAWGLTLAGAKTQSNGIAGFPLFGGQKLHYNSAAPIGLYADVLVGNPNAGFKYSGEAVALYGSKNGLTVVPSVLNPTQSLPNDSTGLGLAMGVFKSQAACPSVASAALGSPGNSTGGNGPFGGVVYSFTPPVSGLNCGLAANASNPTTTIKTNLSGEGPSLPNDGYYPDLKGLAAYPGGDVNNDGYSDLLVSMEIQGVFPGSSTNFYSDSSYNYIRVLAVYYGSPTGINLNAIPSLNPVGKQALMIAPPTSTGCGSGTNLPCYDRDIGSAGFVPMGDVNGDGFSDAMAIGDTDIIFYYGSPSGLEHAVTPNATATGTDPVALPLTVVTGFGWRWNYEGYAFGDFNGDGYTDIALGQWNFAGPGGGGSGGVAVIYGSPTGLQFAGNTAIGCTVTPPTGGTKTWGNGAVTTLCNPNTAFSNPCDGSAPGKCIPQELIAPPAGGASEFGTAVGNAGDVNNDQFDDLLVAAPYDSVFGGSAKTGITYLYYGSARGLVVGTNGYNVVTTGGANPTLSPVRINPASAFTAARYSGYMAVQGVGDINKDGYGDFVISEATNNGGGGFGPGGADLFYGCAANRGGCPPTGVWGVNYTATPVGPADNFSVGAFPGGGSVCDPAVGGCTVNNNGPSCAPGGPCVPLYFLPSGSGIGSPWGWGAGLGGIGDVNGDGYSDIMISSFGGGGPALVSSAGFDLSLQRLGVAAIYSGSPSGLVLGNLNKNPQCISGAGCTPYLVQAPYQNWGQLGTPESVNLTFNQTFLGFANLPGRKMIDFNGDGLADFFVAYQSYWSADHKAYGAGGLIFFQ